MYTVTIVDTGGTVLNSWTIAHAEDKNVMQADYSFPFTHLSARLLGQEIALEVEKHEKEKGDVENE